MLNKIRKNKKVTAPILFLGAFLLLTAEGCESDADKVSTNIATEAEQFKVQRRIVGVNGITDKIEFEVEGRCSFEVGAKRFDLTCKHAADDYRKHTIVTSDNLFVISTQLEGINVSTYRTKIILKPENILPDYDLVTGKQL